MAANITAAQSSVDDIVLAAALAVIKAKRIRHRGADAGYASLYDLNKVLAKLEEIYEKEKTKKLLPLRFVEYSYGPYSPDLERVLEELAAKGLADYVVKVHVPGAPTRGVDEDYAWLIIEHQLSERDADRKYVKKLFKPRKKPRLPRELEEMIARAVNSYIEAAARE